MTAPVVLSLLAFGFLFGPGLAVGAASGLRGWLAVGSAPALTLGVTSVVSQLLPRLGVRFSVTSYAITLLVLCGVLASGIRPWRARTVGAGPSWTWPEHALVAAGAIFTGALGARVMQRGTLSLVGVNQTWDGIFHGSAIRYIAETGNADPSALAPLLQPNAPDFFYPDVFHAVGALLLRTVGGPVQPPLNALTVPLAFVFAVASVAWVRQLTPRPAVAFAVAILAGMFTSLPYEVIRFGTLYPFALAAVAMPAVGALLTAMLDHPDARTAVPLGIAAAGVFATHPSVGFSAVILCVFILGWWGLSAPLRRALTLRSAVALVGAAAVATGILVTNLLALAGQAGQASAIDWPAVGTPSAELGNLVFFGATTPTPQVWLALVFLVGVVSVPRYPKLWPVAGYAAATALLFVEAAGYDGELSLELTQFWWNDRFRLAAMFIVPALPIAALGAVGIYDAATAALPRLRVTERLAVLGGAIRTVARPALAGLAVLLLVLLTNVGYHARNAIAVGRAFDQNYLVRPGATEAFEQLRRLNGLSAPVINNPLDGTGWAYGQADIPVLFKGAFTPTEVSEQELGADEWTILMAFDELDSNPQVQDAVRRLGAHYVITGPARLVSPKGQFPGFTDLADVRSLVPVWSNPAATIYRINLPGANASAS